MQPLRSCNSIGKLFVIIILIQSSLSVAESTNKIEFAPDVNDNSRSWASALEKAEKLVKRMTLDEQSNITFGYTSKKCDGFTGTVERVGFPGLCLNDGPAGVRATDFASAYSAGISVAAAWNQKLAQSRGFYMGREFKAKGVHIALSPVVEPMGRVVEGGRNWEGFGPDPYLAGKLAAQTVQGLQKSVIANIKHFVGYEQETDRNPHGHVASYSSDIDDKTMHELYLWPFQDAVHANVGSVMCSYNRVNSTYACQNGHALNKLLKDELAFPGPVISDFTFGQQSGAASANGGLDMAMPTSQFWHNGKLAADVRQGAVPAARLADMAKRVLAAWFQFIGGPNASFPPGGIGLKVDQLSPHPVVEARDPKSKPSMLQQAIEGHVLVKNVKNALPLRKPKMLSLFGYDAKIFASNYPTSSDFGKWYLGLEPVDISETEILEALLTGVAPNPPESAVLGTLTIGGGSGANQGPYISDPYTALVQQAEEDDTYLLWDFKSQKPLVNPATEACLVFINEVATEAIDRPGLADPKSDVLVKNVASKCENTIVTIHNAGIRLVDAWINNPNVTAVIFAHLPGQVSGKALVEILYGRVSPSGRLPYTVAKSASDYGKLLQPSTASKGVTDPQIRFNEGIHIDYRYFLNMDITPRFPFGFGLTYSDFRYSDLKANWLIQHPPTRPPKPEEKIPGGIKSLFEPIATASLTVTNIGSFTAAEVAQAYVEFPEEKRVRYLRGFAKKELHPGNSTEVEYTFTRRDLSRWNVHAQSWDLQTGRYKIHVGPNVLEIPLVTNLER